MNDIIDFNKIKNKVTDKDLQKFEEYIYELYYKLGEGKINFVQLNMQIRNYMNDNNISEEKFSNIQSKLLDKYKDESGLDLNNIEEQMKDLGVDLSKYGIPKEALNYESLRKNISFTEKYNTKLGQSIFKTFPIENDLNNLNIFIRDTEITIKSKGYINMKDTELNEFLVSYKKTIDDKPLIIEICENIKEYEY